MLKMFLIANPVTSWFNNQLHRFLLWLDQSVYWTASQCYQLFMKLATAQIFTDDFFSSFAKRIYAILGVFMLFYLVYALLNAIVDPDKLTNDKGAGKIAKNLIISLVLLGLLPNLFDLAYRLQNFVLSSNLLGAVILGSDVIDVSDSEAITENNESLIRFGDYASFTVLNAFLNPENLNPTLDGGYNWYGVKKEILEEGKWKNLPLLSDAVSNGTSIGGENIVLTYRPIVSTAAGIFLIYMLLSFTLDLGVRVVKFAFYQLLAPIPIVLRILPSKKGTFDKWLKQTLSVYFEVFVRVGLMYIAIYFINAITTNNTLMEMWTESTSGKLALAIIIIGVFAFAKQAPKIISDVLGIDTGGLKLGIGEKLKAGVSGMSILPGFGLAKSGIGHVGGAISGAAGGAWAAGFNHGDIVSGLAYGATNGWKSKGMQFNSQRSKYYGDIMHGKGRAGWFGGQAFTDKLNDDNRTNAEKKYNQMVERKADKFRESDLYQNYAKNIVRQAQDNYDALKTDLDSKNSFREDYQKSSEYQGIMSRFENESINEANQKVLENLRNGAYNGLEESEKRKRMADDQKTLAASLQHAKTYNELKRLSNMGAASADAMRYISNVESLNTDNQTVKAAYDELELLKKDRTTEGSALAQAEEFFTNSANKNLSEDVKQFQTDLDYVAQRNTEADVKKVKKTKEFQVQAAAYEAALKNINNPNSSKGTSKPGDKK